MINADTLNNIDITGFGQLAKVQASLARRGIILSFAYVKDPVREMFRRTGLEETVGADYFYESVDDGVTAFMQRHSELS